MNNLQNLRNEFDRIEAENAKKMERRKSRKLLEPISAEVKAISAEVKKENDIVMSVDNNTVNLTSHSKRHDGLTP